MQNHSPTRQRKMDMLRTALSCHSVWSQSGFAHNRPTCYHPIGSRKTRPAGFRPIMDQFARIVIGYHGCTADFARDLLLGIRPISAWNPSTNDWDWLGHGIYFWEHSPERALRWAQAK